MIPGSEYDAISRDADSSFSFFNPYEDVEIHSRALPHWEQGNVWYHVSFRLADSIPAGRMEQLKDERKRWLIRAQNANDGAANPLNLSAEQRMEYHQLFTRKVEDWLNAGMGSCVLRDCKVGQVVADALQHFDRRRYRLDEWAVMPNHVHVLVKPIGEHKLSKILHSWKSFTSNEINKFLGKKGTL